MLTKQLLVQVTETLAYLNQRGHLLLAYRSLRTHGRSTLTGDGRRLVNWGSSPSITCFPLHTCFTFFSASLAHSCFFPVLRKTSQFIPSKKPTTKQKTKRNPGISIPTWVTSLTKGQHASPWLGIVNVVVEPTTQNLRDLRDSRGVDGMAWRKNERLARQTSLLMD